MILPILFLKFWYIEAPRGIAAFFVSLNKAFFQLFSTALLLRTYFKPWKNEYREGLVGFSIGMGMFVKTIVLVTTALLFFGLLLGEVIVFLGFLIWPAATVGLLFL